MPLRGSFIRIKCISRCRPYHQRSCDRPLLEYLESDLCLWLCCDLNLLFGLYYMKYVRLQKTVLVDFSSLRRKMLLCTLSLFLVVYASGLRLHACHLHEVICAESICCCSLHANQHTCCTDSSFCEHEHTHSMLILSNVTPVLQNTADNFQKYENVKSPDMFPSLYVAAASFRISSVTAASHPQSRPGRPCPVTGQQLPLLI